MATPDFLGSDSVPFSDDGYLGVPFEERLERMSRAEIICTIQTKAEQIALLAEISGDPSGVSHAFRLDKEHIDRLPTLARPDGLVLNMHEASTIDSVVIRISYSEQVGGVTLELGINDNDDSPKPRSIECSYNGETYPTDSHTSEHQAFQLSTTDFNRFLASIYLPNKTGDYGKFDNLDLTDRSILSSLAEEFEKLIDRSESSKIFRIPQCDNNVEYILVCDSLSGKRFQTMFRRTNADGSNLEFLVSFENEGQHDVPVAVKAPHIQNELAPDDDTLREIAAQLDLLASGFPRTEVYSLDTFRDQEN